MIELQHVSKSLDGGKTFLVHDLSLTVNTGETLVLLGSSGCGKTTTLKMINRLIKPSTGKIFLDRQDTANIEPVSLRRKMGYVFQEVGLFPHMTVAENVAIVLRLEKMPLEQRLQRAYELLEFVNLDPKDYANRMPEELSGGQQQRVGVARALASKPDYLLMDEPFGALDAITRDAIQTDLMRLRKKLNLTIIFVTHDVFEALRLGDHLAIMDRGRLVQVGTAEEIIQKPVNEFVRDLFGKPAAQLAQYEEHVK